MEISKSMQRINLSALSQSCTNSPTRLACAIFLGYPSLGETRKRFIISYPSLFGV
jgi:hypothetical protein